jgi:hypothetical protein
MKHVTLLMQLLLESKPVFLLFRLCCFFTQFAHIRHGFLPLNGNASRWDVWAVLPFGGDLEAVSQDLCVHTMTDKGVTRVCKPRPLAVVAVSRGVLNAELERHGAPLRLQAGPCPEHVRLFQQRI